MYFRTPVIPIIIDRTFLFSDKTWYNLQEQSFKTVVELLLHYVRITSEPYTIVAQVKICAVTKQVGQSMCHSLKTGHRFHSTNCYERRYDVLEYRLASLAT